MVNMVDKLCFIIQTGRQTSYQHFPHMFFAHVLPASSDCFIIFLGDALARQNGQKFTTLDKDYDTHDKVNCAVTYHGAWWYKACHASNLNGKYYNGPHKSYADGVDWYHWKGHHESLKTTEMKFRAWE